LPLYLLCEVLKLSSTCLRGKVFSGHGEGAKFVSLNWALRQIAAKVGFKPYPGTLNVKLTGESANLRKLAEQKMIYRISPPNGYCSGLISEASISNIKCAIVIPLVKDYPNDVLEVIAPFNLRKKLKIRDGDTVSVNVAI
jgi:riboflavin kinase, archaea type